MTLNTAQLDNGTCGQNLQLGSDVTASRVARPMFLIEGDGGNADYDCAIDGISIGRFHTTTPYGGVCVQTPIDLINGLHTLTFVEVLPHPGLATTPFIFRVDTIPPTIPKNIVITVGTINTYGKYPLVITGTADPGTSVKAYLASGAGIGGAAVSSTGSFRIATVAQLPGIYQISVSAQDEAGGQSAKSVPITITVGTALPPPPVPGAPTALGSPVYKVSAVTITWSAPSGTVTAYIIKRGTAPGTEITLATVSGSTLTYTDTAPIVGTDYYTVSAQNSAGTGPPSNEIVVIIS